MRVQCKFKISYCINTDSINLVSAASILFWTVEYYLLQNPTKSQLRFVLHWRRIEVAKSLNVFSVSKSRDSVERLEGGNGPISSV